MRALRPVNRSAVYPVQRLLGTRRASHRTLGSHVVNIGSSASACRVLCDGRTPRALPHPSRSARGALQLHPHASRSPSSRHPPPIVLPRAAAGRHAVRGRENERTDRAAQGENADLKPRDFRSALYTCAPIPATAPTPAPPAARPSRTPATCRDPALRSTLSIMREGTGCSTPQSGGLPQGS